MRRLLAALGLIRRCEAIEISRPEPEDGGCITMGGPYCIVTAKGLEGPFWPTLLGPRPEGYLPESADAIVTFGDGVSAEQLSMFGVVLGAKRAGNKP
jgi:hypothetical protein